MLKLVGSELTLFQLSEFGPASLQLPPGPGKVTVMAKAEATREVRTTKACMVAKKD